MDFFENFNWAVPIAYSDAVSLCYFDEGDVLYDCRSAYEKPWEVARKKITYSVQVRKSGHSIISENRGRSVFDNNWNSKVEVDLYEKLSKTKNIETTYGKLYSLLWRGDIDLLKMPCSPVQPIRLKQVMSHMLDKIVLNDRKIGNRHLSFVLPRDVSTSLSQNKFKKVYSYLSSYISAEPVIISPKEAHLEDWEKIAPTIDFAIFFVGGLKKDELIKKIKAAVYVPTEGAERSMFRLSSHGIII